MADSLELCHIESKGYGMIPKLVMQDQDLDVVAKAFYAYLCSYAGVGNSAFPSMDKICHDLGVSRQRLERHRKALIAKNYITVEKVKDSKGRFDRNVYKLNKEVLPSLPKILLVEPELQNPTTDEPTLQNPSLEKPSSENNTTNNNIFNNNNINNNNINNNTSSAVTPLMPDKSDKEEIKESVKEVIALYKSLEFLPKSIKFQGERLKMVNARIRDFGVESVKEALNTINSSPYFQKAKKDKETWYHFEFIFRQATVVKALEGTYSNRQKGNYNNATNQQFNQSIAPNSKLGF